MGKSDRMTSGERIGSLLLLIAVAAAVACVAFSKGVFSSSSPGYAPVTVEYIDSGAGVSRRDTNPNGDKKKSSRKKTGRTTEKKNSGKGRHRDILDEKPISSP